MRPYLRSTNAERSGSMTQVTAHLPSKQEVLSSNPSPTRSTTKKKKKKKEKEAKSRQRGVHMERARVEKESEI